MSKTSYIESSVEESSTFVYFYVKGLCIKRDPEVSFLLKNYILPSKAILACDMIWTSDNTVLKCVEECKPLLERIIDQDQLHILPIVDATSLSKKQFVKLLLSHIKSIDLYDIHKSRLQGI